MNISIKASDKLWLLTLVNAVGFGIGTGIFLAGLTYPGAGPMVPGGAIVAAPFAIALIISMKKLFKQMDLEKEMSK